MQNLGTEEFAARTEAEAVPHYPRLAQSTQALPILPDGRVHWLLIFGLSYLGSELSRDVVFD